MDLRAPAELLPPIAHCAVRGPKPSESDGWIESVLTSVRERWIAQHL